MNESKIQLGKFLKKENREFHFAISGISGQSENNCFQKVCEEETLATPLKVVVRYPSTNALEHDKPRVAVIGGLNSSENQAQQLLEKAVRKANQIMSDPVVAEFLTLRRETPLKPWPDRKQLEKSCQELEKKLREADKYKYVGN